MEKARQKDKKKRKKIAQQRKREEERIEAKDKANQAENRSSDRASFFVRFPLDRVSGLPGHSVSTNFRKSDLDLNDIFAVSPDVIARSPKAKAIYECLQRPLYFVRIFFELLLPRFIYLRRKAVRREWKHSQPVLIAVGRPHC
jgi:hypothetical protein